MDLRILFSLTIFSQIFFSNAITLAPEAEAPIEASNQTALQRQVSFFDRNHDGVIYPKETFEGLRALGFGIGMSTNVSAVVHAALSKKTSSGKIPAKYLAIEIENIQKAKQGVSDTGVYDMEGRFVPSKFEEIFSKYAHKNPNSLTHDELKEMLQAPNDAKRSLATSSAWKMLYDLGKDKDGLLQKETIRALYEGRFFYQVEKEHSKKNIK